jgi:hypothetical protein
MKKLISKFILKNELVNEDMIVRVEREDDWYLVTIKGVVSNYSCDCYFKDFIELLKYTLNISFTNIAMEEEIKRLRKEVNYGRNKQDI